MRIKKQMSVKEYMKINKINPETALITINGKLVASDKLIKKGDKIEIINFVSRG